MKIHIHPAIRRELFSRFNKITKARWGKNIPAPESREAGDTLLSTKRRRVN
jgi:hypothetical protein